VFVLALTLALFLISKRALAGRRYEMMARGHTGGAEARATPGRTLAIWAVTVSVVGLALLPHLTVIVHSFAEHWFFSVLPREWTATNYGEIFGHGLTASSIRNSLFYSSLSALVDLVLGGVIAWLLTRKRIPFAGLLDALAVDGPDRPRRARRGVRAGRRRHADIEREFARGRENSGKENGTNVPRVNVS